MNKVMAGLFSKAETHRNGLGRVVDDLDHGWKVVEKPFSCLAVKLLDFRRVASDELQILGRLGQYDWFHLFKQAPRQLTLTND
jgi:hypothetical protein